VVARGVSGHSSIPESGRSAVEPLLDFLNDLRALRLPDHPVFGGTTMNIGVLQAGYAPNVIAESARAEVIFRTGESIETLLAHVRPMAERLPANNRDRALELLVAALGDAAKRP
jgi:metal-dependent amidase/aminoacylase/carboxypeptidase family protein